MHILKTSLERSVEKFRKICKKALTLSYERKLCNNNEISTKVYTLLSFSLDIICDVIYYSHDIAVKLAVSK